MEGLSALNTLKFDRELCIGCKMCTIVCPHRVFTMEDRKAKPVRAGACMECGACQLNCPEGAIEVDSGVGCAAAMIHAALTGGEESCDGGCGCGPAVESCSCKGEEEACRCDDKK
jgi:NAD-dependent dihydropyrimidine dehydrogenase PreA subunit